MNNKLESREVPGKKGVVEEQCSKYDANYGAHRVGISANEMVDYYNNWKTYDQV